MTYDVCCTGRFFKFTRNCHQFLAEEPWTSTRPHLMRREASQSGNLTPRQLSTEDMKRHKLGACNFYGTLHLSSNHDSQDTHSLESHWISCFNLPTSMQAAAACRGSVGIALAVDKFVVAPRSDGCCQLQSWKNILPWRRRLPGRCAPGHAYFAILKEPHWVLHDFAHWINKSHGAWMNHTIGTQTKTNIQSKLFAWCAGAREMGKLNCQGP